MVRAMSSEYIFEINDALYDHETGRICMKPKVVGALIRCKDCKHWYSDADTGMACEFTNTGQPEDGFCNWAERRSDE